MSAIEVLIGEKERVIDVGDIIEAVPFAGSSTQLKVRVGEEEKHVMLTGLPVSQFFTRLAKVQHSPASCDFTTMQRRKPGRNL